MFHVITHAQASAENNSVSNFYYYSAAWNVSGAVCLYACVCACLSVCSRVYLGNHTSDLYQVFVHVRPTYSSDPVLL